MRVVIVGASGNVGSALLRALHADRAAPERGAAHEVVGIARRRPADVFPFSTATWRHVDITQPGAEALLVEHFAGADAVVHLAWGFQPMRDVEYLARLGVGGTATVLRAARTASVPHLVHMSSVGAYRAAPGRRVDESWPHDGIPTSVYSEHKAAAEALLDADEAAHAADGAGASDSEQGLVVSRVRPGLVLQRSAGSALLRYGLPACVPAALLEWLPIVPIDRALTVPVVHADDLASAVLRILETSDGGAYNVAAEPPITADLIAEALGARRLQAPARVLRAAADLTFRARLQRLDPGWLDLAFGVPLLDTSRVRALGWQPRHTATAALAELVAGMREAASAPSPVLRKRTVQGSLRELVTDGPITSRHRP